MVRIKSIGDNIVNNKVYIDFKKQSITFKPVESNTNFFFIYVLNISLVLIFIYLILYIILLITQIYYNLTDFIFFKVAFSSLYFLLLVWLQFIILYFIPYFRKNIYPIHNAYITKIMRLFRLNKDRWFTVNKEAIIDNKFIIPEFSNVELQFKATKDFSFYLDEIKIINHYLENDFKFMAVFIFSKTPKEGELKILYN